MAVAKYHSINCAQKHDRYSKFPGINYLSYICFVYAGRNLEEVPILIVDIGSEASVQEMCQKTKVVVNCVGPVSSSSICIIQTEPKGVSN